MLDAKHLLHKDMTRVVVCWGMYVDGVLLLLLRLRFLRIFWLSFSHDSMTAAARQKKRIDQPHTAWFLFYVVASCRA